jgi:D-methionine transport system substrate-binding protein
VAGIHYEPFGLYAGKTASIDALADGAQIAVPNDPSNEARALQLLQQEGLITLKEGVGLDATKADITANPKNLEIVELEAQLLPTTLQDVDMAVINGNYAIGAGIDTSTALASESTTSEAGKIYANVIACREGEENSAKIQALVAALESKAVADYITETYAGAVVSVVENPGTGYSDSVDYAALKGTEISVAASPTPHAEILAIAADILAEKDITLKVVEYGDYILPNNVVESGELDANYFQHVPYLDDFNANNGTHLVSVSAVHVEPMGLYGGQQSTLDALK